MLFQLLGHEVLFCNLQLFLVRIRAQLDNLHTVAQGRGNGVQRIGRCDKQHVRQIKRQFDKVIAERSVLLGVKDLKQRRTRIPLVVTAQLVDFVNQNQAVAAASLNQGVDDAARHGADIGSAVAANICLITHAAQRKPCVFAPHATRNGPRHRRFADARRADQTEDLALDFACHAFNGEKLQDALLDLFQTIMVGIEDFLRLLDALIFTGHRSPRQLEAGVKICADNTTFRR